MTLEQLIKQTDRFKKNWQRFKTFRAHCSHVPSDYRTDDTDFMSVNDREDLIEFLFSIIEQLTVK